MKPGISKTYTHIFFDLDRTLWDFETNSHLTLSQLYNEHKLEHLGIENCGIFIDSYKEINQECWSLYQTGKMSKDILRGERFRRTLACFEITDADLAEEIGKNYVELSPVQKALLPNAREILDYLNERYVLHIITNGFDEVQHLKIASSGLEGYFKNVITSESAGGKKPDIAVFNFALECCNARSAECIMIGDDLTADIAGARQAEIDQVFFNPQRISHSESPTYEITNLLELKTIL